MLTREQAEAQGFTINNHAPGRPTGYKGRTFSPTAVVGILTDLEVQMLAAIKVMTRKEGDHFILALSEGADVTSLVLPIMREVNGA